MNTVTTREFLDNTLNPERLEQGQEALSHETFIDTLYDEFGEDIIFPIVDGALAMMPEHVITMGMRMSKTARELTLQALMGVS